MNYMQISSEKLKNKHVTVTWDWYNERKTVITLLIGSMGSTLISRSIYYKWWLCHRSLCVTMFPSPTPAPRPRYTRVTTGRSFVRGSYNTEKCGVVIQTRRSQLSHSLAELRPGQTSEQQQHDVDPIILSLWLHHQQWLALFPLANKTGFENQDEEADTEKVDSGSKNWNEQILEWAWRYL